MTVAIRSVRLIGIGAGNPHSLTLRGVRALRDVDYFFVADKRRPDGSPDPLAAARDALLRHYLPEGYRLISVADPARNRDGPQDYQSAVEQWHAARVPAYEQVLLTEPGTAGFLVWGDPGLYDSTIRIIDRIRDRGSVDLSVEVVPGVSSIAELAAAHRIVLHEIGQPVHITTGRRLAEDVSTGQTNIVVMLDAGLSAAALPGAWKIWWAANLGSEYEMLISGELSQVASQIEQAKQRIRRACGWVMDVYLLRRLD